MSLASNQSEISIQVRYSETDAMKFVYYANYLVYFEVARTAAMAELGHPYSEMEKKQVLIPVLAAHCEYLKPAYYGDNLILQSLRWRKGKARIRFDYIVLRETDMLAKGYTEHAFMDPAGKPIRPPEQIISLFPDYIAG